MRDKPLSEREVGAQLINETVAFAESSVCREVSRISLFYAKNGIMKIAKIVITVFT